MSRQRRFNNIRKVTREQFLFMHNFNSSGGDVWYLNYVVLEHTLLLLYTFTYASTLLSPSLDPAILDQEESCPDPPPPRSSDGVMEWAGLARCCCSLWGCDSHWAQSSLYIGSRSKVRITITQHQAQHRVSWSWGWLLVLCSAPSVPQPVFTITEEALLLALSHLRHY